MVSAAAQSLRRLAMGATAVALAVALAACAAPGATRDHAPPAAAPGAVITGTTTPGPLRVERLELVFDNGFGTITLPRDSRLAATAILRYRGSGSLRAEWRVDGRPVELVNQIITHGSTLRLPLAPTTVLPTFEPGPHTVTLSILAPQVAFDLPAIHYFVTLDAPRD